MKRDWYGHIRARYGITQLPTVDILDLLPELSVRIEPYSGLVGGSMILDMVLLKGLAQSTENCHYLEIGTWRGETLGNMLEVCERVVGLTLGADEMRVRSYNPAFVNSHGLFIRGLPEATSKLGVIYADSLTYDFGILRKQFDLVFIDADHRYKAVYSDTVNLQKVLRDENSVMVWHDDYGTDVETPRHEVLAGILDGMPPEEHRHLYHVSNTYCAVYIRNREFKTYISERFASPVNKWFSIDVVGHRI